MKIELMEALTTLKITDKDKKKLNMSSKNH